MTLPTTIPINDTDDDSDMFGPPRSSPPIGFHHHRSRVPMISPKLRQREERKRILQLCAHKLERIKDSETNLRRSVCINNTYSRLNDELRREKQSRYLANLPKSEPRPESAHKNVFNACSNHCNNIECNENSAHESNNNSTALDTTSIPHATQPHSLTAMTNTSGCNHHIKHNSSNCSKKSTICSEKRDRKRSLSSNSVDADLEKLDRELSAINASMPLIDPEITQGAEQLEKAMSSRKRLRSEDESDRLVREALSQFYIPPQRLISALDDCPLDSKRIKLAGDLDLDLAHEMNQSQKEFEVIMDALRFGTSSPTGNDSCGQAAMMSESGLFHNLVVTSLET
ncbi:uncharacterized protein LOC129939409 [Eupeodes corollae]|uniref:uncharacterized protein LOC129939409 n=1 Tax=Eupeodes corollae TaxID=290404 RepID=UPI00248FBC93|nr:uncharacterized protein LOC129939409 [Eupeodes corollae]